MATVLGERRGSRQTGANSKTSTATNLDHGELASWVFRVPVGQGELVEHGQFTNDARGAQAGH